MLLDINSPESRAILAAARHLEALHAIWRSSDEAPVREVDGHIESLRALARTHFVLSAKIDAWLIRLSSVLKSNPAARLLAKATYDELIVNLDGDEGFQTVYI
jgi:hypothetical protein